jgi:hypothetical protein
MMHPDDVPQYYGSQGEYLTQVVREYAREHGAMEPDRAWILSPLDTWERNPFYRGPPVRHPEDDRDDD